MKVIEKIKFGISSLLFALLVVIGLRACVIHAETKEIPTEEVQTIELVAILANPQDPTLVDFLLYACGVPLVVTFPQSQLANEERVSQTIIDRATEVCNNVTK